MCVDCEYFYRDSDTAPEECHFCGERAPCECEPEEDYGMFDNAYCSMPAFED